MTALTYMQKNNHRINFFYDSKKLNRDWYFDPYKSAKSGTEFSMSILPIYLSNFFNINFYCTKIPNDNIYKNISFKKVNSILAVEKKIKSNEFLILNFDKDISYQKLLLKKKNKSKKYIIWMHNTPSYEWLSKFGSNEGIYRLIAVSDSQRLKLSHTKVFKKIIAMPHTVEVTHKFKKDYKIKNQVLYIGALVPSKGFHLLSKIWPSIFIKYPDWILKVLGGANLYFDLDKKKDADIYKYENNFLSYVGGSYQKAKKYGIIFEGSIPKKKLLLEILKSELIVVNPNVKDSFETFCISAAEGLVLGKPILGGNRGSLPEVIKHNVGGLLHNNNTEFKKNLSSMIENKNLRYQLGKRGQKNYLFNFNNKKIIKRWKDLLNKKNIKNYYNFSIYRLQFFEFLLRSLFRYFIPNKLVPLVTKFIKIYK